MCRAVTITALVLGAALMGEAMAEEQRPAAQSTQPGAAQAQAAQRARQALAKHLDVAEDAVTVTRVEPRTWSDSSMGCRTPGTAALTVITEGYAVFLSAQDREHEVHVSGSSAVVCDEAKSRVIRREPHRAARGLGLDVMMERARQDLAQRLGVEASTIRLAGLQPQRWPDSALDCPWEGETVQPGPIDGYRLSLKHSSRIYTYHTDRKTVRPCPAIESQ